ncbi:MAG TPA: hypothetical protein VKQ34_00570 [Candidatus Saccharimonadales bacterium]|nr:hypothetical protein [Candidatus Saccharimonadales bacterium]
MNVKRNMPVFRRLALSVAGLLSIAIMGSASVAAAQSPAPTPSSKQACMHDGWKHLGDGSKTFKNQGQCVSWWEKHHNPGHGYGGSSVGIDNNVNVSITGNGNSVSNAVGVAAHAGGTVTGTIGNFVHATIHGSNNVLSNIVSIIFG